MASPSSVPCRLCTGTRITTNCSTFRPTDTLRVQAAANPCGQPAPAGSQLSICPRQGPRAVVTCVVIVLGPGVLSSMGISWCRWFCPAMGASSFTSLNCWGLRYISQVRIKNPFYIFSECVVAEKESAVVPPVHRPGFFLLHRRPDFVPWGKEPQVNRNKSSHHETNSAYMLSPKPQKKFVDQACGPSHSKESVVSPKMSAGQSTMVRAALPHQHSD